MPIHSHIIELKREYKEPEVVIQDLAQFKMEHHGTSVLCFLRVHRARGCV